MSYLSTYFIPGEALSASLDDPAAGIKSANKDPFSRGWGAGEGRYKTHCIEVVC